MPLSSLKQQSFKDYWGYQGFLNTTSDPMYSHIRDLALTPNAVSEEIGTVLEPIYGKDLVNQLHDLTLTYYNQ
jgi:hypothetical protein